ncbi:MAG: ThiF family adenylyltransferase [Proteobacteria bacterium]|nr:ThiF family adenylyltransferase [Pseudomonadota bacterium]
MAALMLGLLLLPSTPARAQPASDAPRGFTAEELLRLQSQGADADAALVARYRRAIFQRNLRFTASQDRVLQDSTLAVAGATTELGWLSAELLTRLGVGALRLSELGQTEVERELGQTAPARGSIEALVAYLRQLNPSLQLEVTEGAGPRELAELARGAALVLDVLPNAAPDSRWALHHAARLRHVPVIQALTLGDGARLARFEPGGPTHSEVMGLSEGEDHASQVARTAAGAQPAARAQLLATPRARATIAEAALRPSAFSAIGMAAALLTDATMARVLGLPGLPPAPQLTFLDPSTGSFHTGATLAPTLWMKSGTLTQAPAEAWSRLADKGIGIFGAGAVGGWVAWILARTTAQLAPQVAYRLRLVDGDSYDWPNIQRQLGAELRTIGQAKVEVLASLLAALGAGAPTVEARKQMLGADDADALLAGLDAVIPAVDIFAEPARQALCDAAGRAGLPFLDRGPFGRGSAGGLFLPRDGLWSALTGSDPAHMNATEMLARHMLVVAGGLGTHLHYMRTPTIKPQVDLAKGRAPSLASACVLTAALTSHQTLAHLLGLPTPSTLTQVDPFHSGKSRAYPIRGNASLWRRALLAVVIRAALAVHCPNRGPNRGQTPRRLVTPSEARSARAPRTGGGAAASAP